MPVLKCKMCGGSLNIIEGQTVCECEYCGTKQTLPKLDSERKLNLYDRASYLRRSNDFDKATVIYEQILAEDKTDAEAYWSLVLCKYGVEYVEDPSSHKRIPTVNRTQLTSIFNDPDYKEALNHASVDQKIIYEGEAKKIDDIQKSILDISKKEDPYDIFICYKETDSNGRRTMDSVLAQDIYNALTKEGYKVFFSRISLEDKIGVAYEPYIFAALNSAKVMIVAGTNKDNLNAVWVKNEWSRYLSMIKKGDDKILVPAYKDMDPYDLPEEFAYLQAQDMSKLGFMQDLIRGIDKIFGKDKIVQNDHYRSDNQKIQSLMKRMYLFLEDKRYKDADEYADKVLDIDPENGEAYLGKVLSKLKLTKIEELGSCSSMFEDDPDYLKACRFSDGNLSKELADLTSLCRKNNESLWKKQAKELLSARNRESILQAKKIYEYLNKWTDCKEELSLCDGALNDIEEAGKKKAGQKKVLLISALAFVVLIALAVFGFTYYQNTYVPASKYNEANELINQSRYREGLTILKDLGDYKDSKEIMLKTIKTMISSKDKEINDSFFLNRLLEFKDTTGFDSLMKEYINTIILSFNDINFAVLQGICTDYPDYTISSLYEYYSENLTGLDFSTDGFQVMRRMAVKLESALNYLTEKKDLEIILNFMQNPWDVSKEEINSIRNHDFIMRLLKDKTFVNDYGVNY